MVLSTRICIGLLIITSLVAVHYGFLYFDPGEAVDLVRRFGYYGILITFCLYVGLVWKVYHPLVRLPFQKENRRELLFVAIVIPVCATVLFVHEANDFKILMDEINLLGTSMGMHYERKVFSPLRAYDLNGSFLLLNGYVDKRPYLFPFLVSLLHDFGGYRPTNAIFLNLVLLPIFLIVIYWIGRRFAGFWGGILSLLLMTGVPLLAQVANGGGFELLNILFIAIVTLHALQYLDEPNAPNLACLLVSVVLLSQSRYESVIFVFPVAVVILLGWFKKKQIMITWTLIATPLLMLPYALLHQVFNLKESSWQMQSKESVDAPFGFEYVLENFGHAFYYFFSLDDTQPNSFLLAVLGTVLGVFFIVWIGTRLPQLLKKPDAQLALLVMMGGLSLLFLLLMAYFWGQFHDPVVRRLSLPLFLLFLYPVLFMAGKIPRRFVIGACVVSGLFLHLHAIPKMGKNIFTQDYLPGRHYAWRREFMEQHPSRDYLVIDNPGIWVTHRKSAIPHAVAEMKKRELKFLLDSKAFREIYVIQPMVRDLANNALVPNEFPHLGPDFILEDLFTKSFTGLSVIKVMRVVDVKVDDPIQFDKYIDFDEYADLKEEDLKEKEREFLLKWAEHLP